MLRSWLNARSKPKSGSPRVARRPRSARLFLEHFEERTVPTFNPTNYVAGAGAASVVVANFQGTGTADVAVANITAGTVSVLLNNNDGSGTLRTAVNYNVGAAPVSIAAGDLTGDGLSDIVVTNAGGTTATVLYNDASNPGTFLPATTLQLGGTGPRDVRLADLNGDGFLDIVTADYTTNQVSVLLNNGDGSFGAAHTYASGGTATYALAIADFDGDGHLDVAVGSVATGVTILNGNGDGTLQTARQIAAPGLITGLAAGDLGNGAQDLVSANNNTGTITVLLNDGSGNFTRTDYPASTQAPLRMILADVNGDGILDAITPNFTSTGPGNISIFYGNGDGTLQARQNVNSGGNQPSAVAAADIEGDAATDGLTDLVVSNFASGNVTVLLNSPAPAVVSTTLTGTINLSVSDGQVVFSEPIDPNTFTPDQFVLLDPNGNQVNVTGINALDGTNTRFDVTFDTQTTLGTYNLTIGPNILDATDTYSMTAPFTSSFTLVNNLIANGGFETGSFAPWTQFGDTSFSGVETANPHSGTHDAFFGPTSAIGGIMQTVNTTAGQTYQLSLWLSHPFTDTGTEFRVQIGGMTVDDQMNPGNFNYTQFTYSYTATGSTTTIQLGFLEPPSYFYLDDVSFTPGAAPGPGGSGRITTNLANANLTGILSHPATGTVAGLRPDAAVQAQVPAVPFGLTTTAPAVSSSNVAPSVSAKLALVHGQSASAAAVSDPLGVNLVQGTL